MRLVRNQSNREVRFGGSGILTFLSLVLLLSGPGCSTEQRESYRPATRREQAFPFTGRWRSPGGERRLCLYQMDARTVTGWMDRQPAAGIVAPDGSLYLSVSAPSSAAALKLRKEGVQLRILECVNSAGPAVLPDSTYNREG